MYSLSSVGFSYATSNERNKKIKGTEVLNKSKYNSNVYALYKKKKHVLIIITRSTNMSLFS